MKSIYNIAQLHEIIWSVVQGVSVVRGFSGCFFCHPFCFWETVLCAKAMCQHWLAGFGNLTALHHHKHYALASVFNGSHFAENGRKRMCIQQKLFELFVLRSRSMKTITLHYSITPWGWPSSGVPLPVNTPIVRGKWNHVSEMSNLLREVMNRTRATGGWKEDWSHQGPLTNGGKHANVMAVPCTNTF